MLLSLEIGRFVEASSLASCLVRFAGESGSHAGVRTFLDDLDDEGLAGVLTRAGSLLSSMFAFDWERLMPFLGTLGACLLARKAEGWFSIESIFLNSAMWMAE